MRFKPRLSRCIRFKSRQSPKRAPLHPPAEMHPPLSRRAYVLDLAMSKGVLGCLCPTLVLQGFSPEWLSHPSCRQILECRRSTQRTCLRFSRSRRPFSGVQAHLSTCSSASHMCECRSRPCNHPLATPPPCSSSPASPDGHCPTSTTYSLPTPRPSYNSNQKCARVEGTRRDCHSVAAEIHGGEVRLPIQHSTQAPNDSETVNSSTFEGYAPF